MATLGHFGTTQQRLLRKLSTMPEGCTVESLCSHLRISHNAVRQHLSSLLVQSYVEHGQARASGGRPKATFRLTEAGRALFPRNYGVLAAALLAQLQSSMGADALEEFLKSLGRTLGSQQVALPATAAATEVAQTLANHLDALGYEALAVANGRDSEVEAFNCVFHTLAKTHPQVCHFDIAYMEAASGRRIHHMECIVRGGSRCRFRVGEPLAGDPD
ncbi:MAG: MarR family transcriptional regulator [Gammaproteobacteria bacterium HGW-Gammaproteobacteria-4]|jgi:predicted ArsR family transcriptional regulator|nr:MAG: MarR family transcriptional regulator [Gammaproteobacteria bacterium HGW-Gammaproteobacteria-4]